MPALVSVPAACLLVGGSLATLPYAGLTRGAVVGLLAFVGRWVGICAWLSFLVAVPAGAVVWLGRGVASRLGWPGRGTADRRRRRRLRWAFAAGLGAVGLVAGIAGGSYLIRYSFRNAEEAVAETDALDPDWRLDDLMATREEVPDDENSAMIVADVVDLLPEGWPQKPSREPGLPEAETDGPLDAATALERAEEAEESRSLPEDVATAIGDELDTLAEEVEMAREVADYERGRHELELGPILIDTLLPETQAARGVARLLRADALVSAHDGTIDEALDSCRAILGVARSIGDEPFAISQLVRTAIDVLAVQTARRALAQGEASDEALAALQDLILDEYDRPRLRYALRGERAILFEVIRRVAEGELPFEALAGAKGPDGGPPPVRSLSGLTIVGGWYQTSVALRWFNELIAIPDLPEEEWRDALAAYKARVEAVKESRLGPYIATLPLLMMPAASAILDTELRVRAELGSAAVLVAAERQRRATGAWPASAAEIDDEFLNAGAPLDPYTGEPFRMEHVDGLLHVYSIGPNLRDEHGSYDPKKWGRFEADDDVGTVGYDPELRGRPPRADAETANGAAPP
ncbi:hypothetical protein [Planctomyces sp. SH-PL62]|uniref:hypothetical protein n=1 Tax=Planctomyces sp. SH-PL62 TaxID=1636152 RepID=UPI00078D6159|nr:hypothetical protein [Planctomyces sp. SH-PL62]AMV38077.1 hypothetical protein VT85_11610 [Planctomyces sp. SH-PL62]